MCVYFLNGGEASRVFIWFVLPGWGGCFLCLEPGLRPIRTHGALVSGRVGVMFLE